MERVLVWHRHNLRLHDRPDLQRALAAGGEVIPFYCFDSREFGETAFGFPKTGAYRSQFLREAVADLRQNLRRLGSDLVIRQGKPEEVIPKLVRELRIDWVICEEEVTTEERRVEDAVQMQLGGVPLKKEWGMTLYHPSQLPFSIAELPDVFYSFPQGR